MDATQFQPAAEPSTNNGRVTVVALSRLVYRKGVDLLNVVVPAVCRRHPHVDFIIGGLPLDQPDKNDITSASPLHPAASCMQASLLRAAGQHLRVIQDESFVGTFRHQIRCNCLLACTFFSMPWLVQRQDETYPAAHFQ